jgi:hypothetical protein
MAEGAFRAGLLGGRVTVLNLDGCAGMLRNGCFPETVEGVFTAGTVLFMSTFPEVVAVVEGALGASEVDFMGAVVEGRGEGLCPLIRSSRASDNKHGDQYASHTYPNLAYPDRLVQTLSAFSPQLRRLPLQVHQSPHPNRGRIRLGQQDSGSGSKL